MRSILLALTVTLAPALVGAEEVWRWKDGRGVLHYSNHTRNVPADAAVVKTPITLEVKRLPGAPVEPVLDLRGGQVMDSADRPAARRRIASPARSTMRRASTTRRACASAATRPVSSTTAGSHTRTTSRACRTAIPTGWGRRPG